LDHFCSCSVCAISEQKYKKVLGDKNCSNTAEKIQEKSSKISHTQQQEQRQMQSKKQHIHKRKHNREAKTK